MGDSQAQAFDAMPTYGTSTIKITVGSNSEKEAFVLHESLASKHSEYIAHAIEDDHEDEDIIHLPGDNPKHFRSFQTFIYTGRVLGPQAHKGVSKVDFASHIDRLVELWILGEKLQAKAYQDAIVDALLNCVRKHRCIPSRSCKAVWHNSSGPSGMRKLHIDFVIYGWSREKLMEVEEGMGEFWYDLAMGQHEFIKNGGEIGKVPEHPFLRDVTCKYHEHGDEEECYKETFGLEAL